MEALSFIVSYTARDLRKSSVGDIFDEIDFLHGKQTYAPTHCYVKF